MPMSKVLLLTGVTAMALAGCKSERDKADRHVSSTLPMADTVTPGAPTMNVIDSAAGALAHRREAEPLFERARSTLSQRQAAGTAAALREATAFFRSVRDSASGPVRARLSTVSGTLDSLARAAEGKSGVTRRMLDHAFANANVVEAERHESRMAAAWTRKDTVTTAEELLITIDHLERARRDAQLPTGKNDALVLADGRRLGVDLLKHIPLTSASTMSRVQDDLRAAIGRTAAQIDAAKARAAH